MSHANFVSVPVSVSRFAELVSVLQQNGGGDDVVTTMDEAIRLWLDKNGGQAVQAISNDASVGYKFSGFLLPDGTKARMKYKGEYHYATVQGEYFTYDNERMSPSQFANMVTGTSRSAPRDLEFMCPGDKTWSSITVLKLFDELDRL